MATWELCISGITLPPQRKTESLGQEWQYSRCREWKRTGGDESAQDHLQGRVTGGGGELECIKST